MTIGKILLIAATVLASCHPPMTLVRTETRINKQLGRQQGVFAVAFKDLATGEELLIREEEVFHAASTMKTAVLIEVFKQSAEGKFSLSDSILIKKEFNSIVDGSVYHLNASGDNEKELYASVGKKQTVGNLVYKMITVSSNLSTNILIDLVGAKNTTESMRDLGAGTIQVLRGVEDSLAYARGLNNTTTARDLMMIFQKIARGEAVNPQSCQSMIDILLQQRFNEIIPAQLPARVKVAHKTGSFPGVHHDSGIVFLPDGRKYVLVILSKDLVNDRTAVKSMAVVSKLIYQHVNSAGSRQSVVNDR